MVEMRKDGTFPLTHDTKNRVNFMICLLLSIFMTFGQQNGIRKNVTFPLTHGTQPSLPVAKDQPLDKMSCLATYMGIGGSLLVFKVFKYERSPPKNTSKLQQVQTPPPPSPPFY